MTTTSSLVHNAKQYTREAIMEAWPSVKELTTPTDEMYEFDAICIDEVDSDISSISIMHDPDTNTFALVEIARKASKGHPEPEIEKPTPLPAWPIDWGRLKQDHEIAFLRGDLATSSPESYSIDEMREISEAMDASTEEIEAALRADFNAMSPQAQSAMLEMLCTSDPTMAQWWRKLLIGDMPNSTDEL